MDKLDHYIYKRISHILSQYLVNFFKTINIALPERIIEELWQRIDGELLKCVQLDTLDQMKMVFDLATIQSLPLKKIVGIQRSIELSQRALDICIAYLAEKEPFEVIRAFLARESGFYYLIELIFKEYIDRVVYSKYSFLQKLSTVQQDIILEKIKTNMTLKYDYFVTYDPAKATFKTFLYSQIIFSAIAVFRDEGMEQNIYQFHFRDNDDTFQMFLQKLDKDRHKVIYDLEQKIFNCKKEAIDFVQQYGISGTSTELNAILDTLIKKKSIFGQQKISMQENQHYPDTFEMNPWQDYHEIVQQYLEFESYLKNDESAFYRALIKFQFGFNINFLNDEFSVLIPSLTLDLLLQANTLIQSREHKPQGQFLKECRIFLESFSSVQVKTDSAVQQRIYRNYKKISKLFDRTEIEQILSFGQREETVQYLNHPLLFLIIRNGTVPEKQSENLQLVDLCYNKIATLPDQILTLKKLKELDLRFNHIRYLPEKLFAIETLRVVDIRNQMAFESNDRNSCPEGHVLISQLCNQELLSPNGIIKYNSGN